MTERYETTKRKLRVAPTQVLERTQRLYGRVERVSFLATIVCLLLGIWVDPRWLATGLLPVGSWVLSHQVDDLFATELERRRAEANGCPDQVG